VKRVARTGLLSGRAFCQLGFERLGSSSWLCQARAHLDEQNGSPLLRATSGRSPPQHTQRPSGCTGGFAFSGGCFPTRHEPTVSRHARGGSQPAGSSPRPSGPRPYFGLPSEAVFATKVPANGQERKRQPYSEARDVVRFWHVYSSDATQPRCLKTAHPITDRMPRRMSRSAGKAATNETVLSAPLGEFW
jgi:hypothetical protein